LKILDRTAESMEKAIIQVVETLPFNAFKTETTDRGKEFACFQSIQDKLGITILLIPTLHGNVAAMKTPMVCCGSFIQRKLTSLESTNMS